ncbi:MAG: hypothetical protein V4753_11690 [Pseudomonadota bacterium]
MIRGPISILIVGALSLFMVMLVSLGPRGFEGILPEPVIALLERQTFLQQIGGAFGAGNDTSPGGTPADLLDDGKDGLVARGPIAALAGNRPVFITDVIDGHMTRVSTDIPAEIMTIRPITGCKLTPPLDGTAVGHVTASDSGLELALRTYNDRTLAAAVQGFVNSYRASGSGQVTDGEGIAYQAYDVAVTETARPVYLVLVNLRGNRIWNIHLAPGARVERVVLLGGDQAGVANLDPVIPVEVIPAAGLADCGLNPAYALNPGHRFFEVLRDGTGTAKAEAEAKLVLMEDAIAAWNTWFRDSFGVLADDTRAGFDRGMVSVVGPLPGEADPRAVYAPIEGARIRMTQDKYFEIRGQSAKADSFAGRVEAIATSFAFGDLTYLRQGVPF